MKLCLSQWLALVTKYLSILHWYYLNAVHKYTLWPNCRCFKVSCAHIPNQSYTRMTKIKLGASPLTFVDDVPVDVWMCLHNSPNFTHTIRKFFWLGAIITGKNNHSHSTLPSFFFSSHISGWQGCIKLSDFLLLSLHEWRKSIFVWKGGGGVAEYKEIDLIMITRTTNL